MKKSLIKNSLFNSAYTILNLVFPIISSAYVSRILQPSGVGSVAYSQNIVYYFTLISALGLPGYGTREIARVGNNQKQINQLFVDLFVFNAITTIISIFVFLVTIFSISKFSDNVQLYLASGLVIFLNFFNIDWFYKGKEEYVYIVTRNLVIKTLSLICLLTLVKGKDDYIIYAWILSISTGSNYLFNMLHARKYVRFDLKKARLKPHVKPIIVLSLGTVLSTFYSKIDVTMLGTLPNDEHIGFYVYSQRIVEIMINLCTSITAVFMPRLSYCYNSDKNEFNKLVGLGLDVLVFLSIPLAAGCFILSGSMIRVLFGAEFEPSVIDLQIFTPLIVVRSIGDLLCFQVVICIGLEKERIPACIFASLANIILNTCMIPVLNERGAAIASVVSELIIFLYQFFKVKKIVQIPINVRAIIQALASTAIMIIGLIIIQTLQLHDFINIIISFIVGVTLYFGMNVMMKNEFLYCTLKKIRFKNSL